MKKSDFYFALPESLIAQQPLEQRSASRMLVLDSGGEIADKRFSDFIDLLDAKDLLVFNNTKVIPARLYGRKQTGGKVEILIERVLDDGHALAHIRASKAPKPGTWIELDEGYRCEIISREQALFKLAFQCDGTLHELLDQLGHMPLPPYIRRQDNARDRTRYQTVFAHQEGAVAAPTAGLHFDREMMSAIAGKGIEKTFVTLHVGSGTFQPVRVENLDDHVMHHEYFEVSEATVAAVQRTRQRGGRVIAIGTTAVRALESASSGGKLETCRGETNLFITQGYRFQSVDALLTNFHLPESTLLMLVSAFAGRERIMAAYQHAIRHCYRFFSYGDAMFIAQDWRYTQ